MPKIRQTNKVMKVGNQWLPAFLNSVNGSPTYTYMNDSGQWADASGNTYNVEHPLDEVTVKYDPKTGGQINKAAPDYWRQYGQRRMQQTAGNVDKVIMGTVGAATAPLWLPEIYGAGLVLGGNPAVQQFANQVLYGLGADAALKATTGYDYSEAGQRLFSNPLRRIGLSKGTSDLVAQLTGGALNPGYYMPAMKALKLHSSGPMLKQTKRANDIKSELDWSPESWFKTRATGSYDAQDVAALTGHVPEYREIERVAKSNGTWLKMPDGSLWQGDPRTWVQMQSVPYKKYVKDSPFANQIFSHTTDSKFDRFNYDYFGRTDNGFYGRGFYSSPAELTPRGYRGINTYGDTNYLLATNVKHPLDLNSRDWEWAGAFNWPKTNAPSGIFDKYDSVYYGIPGITRVGTSPAELVVPKSSNYKSLLGNNGDFNEYNDVIYKTLIPTIIGGAYYTNTK